MFLLDPRIAEASTGVAALSLCEVRLQDDARFRWLVLIPQRALMRDLDDLSAADQSQLILEVAQASRALRAACAGEGYSVDKLNLGALGNIVPQLHVHLVARRIGDAAWPGPVWGAGTPEPYGGGERLRFVRALQDALMFDRADP